MEDLPTELVRVVLLHPLLRDWAGLLRQVCRRWRDIVERRQTHVRVVFGGSDALYALTKPWSKNEVALYAAEYAPLAVLRTMEASGTPFQAYTALSRAARTGDLALGKWLMRGDKHEGPHELHAILAAEHGHLEFVRWLHSKGCPWTTNAFSMAIRGGHLDVLQWAHSHNLACNSSGVCREAARSGQLEVLQWAKAVGCPWSAATSSDAALMGHLHILKWLRSQDPPCPWDATVCQSAAYEGHFELLQWAHANGCPWDTRYDDARVFVSRATVSDLPFILWVCVCAGRVAPLRQTDD